MLPSKYLSHPHLYRYNNKTYIVDSIAFDLNTESKFSLSHDSEIFEVSYFDYFTKRYNEEITQKKQPMIVAKNSLREDAETVYLVPELCYLVGITDQMRNRKDVWREIKKVLRVDAPVRIRQMETFIEQIFKKNGKMISEWGM